MNTKKDQQQSTPSRKRVCEYLPKWLRSRGVIVVGTLLLVVIIVGVVWFRTYLRADVAVYGIQKSPIWFPATAIAPMTIISGNDVASNLTAVRSFYENQDFSSAGYRVDFSTQDGLKRLKVREKEILNIFVEQEAMRRIVEEANMRVTDAEVSENVDRKLREFGSAETVKGELQKLYGWDLEDFKERVVKPSMYREKAKSVFDNTRKVEKNILAYEKISEANEALSGGEDFSSVAKRYSEGSTAQDGGHFGWLSLGEIVEPEVAKTILSLEANQMSDIIESDLGYHIVKVGGTKKDSSGMLYDVSQIFVAKLTFAEFLESKMKTMYVRVLLPGYEWDAERGLIVFSDPAMREFETQVAIETMTPDDAESVDET
jgi:hypothetical protein